MFVYHFVDPDLRVETFFEKDEAAENGGVDFEIRDIGLSAHLYLRLKKISCRACLLSYYFFVTKTVRLLLTCLNSLEEGFSCFPGRGWEGVSGNILSLVKMYQRI